MPSALDHRERQAFFGRVSAAVLSVSIVSGCGARSALELASDRAPDERPPPVAADAFACAPGDDARPMLAARVNDALFFGYPDRSVREIHRFDVPSDGYVVGGSNVIARGDLVAANVVVAPLGQASSVTPHVEVVVVDVDGTVRFQQRYDFAYQGWGSDSRLHGSAEGAFVVSMMEVEAGLGIVVEDGAASTFSRKMAGRGDPDAGGRMLFADYEASSSVAFHFFDLVEGTFTPTRYWLDAESGRAESSPAVVDGGILYARRDPSRLVFEDGYGSRELPIDVSLSASDYASPGASHSGGWALFVLGGDAPETVRYLAARFATQSVRAFRLAPPSPWLLPGDYWNPPAIDSAGRVVIVLSGGDRYQTFATTDGLDWTPVGRPVTSAGSPMHVLEAGGAVVLDSAGGGPEPAEGALPSYADQVIGPQGGEGVELVRDDLPGEPDNPVYGADALSADGRCLAYFKNGSVHVVETATYEVSDLGLVSSTQSAELAWIPLPP